MRIFKLICVVFCAWSLVSALRGAYEIYAAAGINTSAIKGSLLDTILSIVSTAFWTVAFYGVYKRSVLAWKLGWVAIGAFFVEFVAVGLVSTARLPRVDSPTIASAAVIVLAMLAALFAGLWWNRQKGYFDTGETKASKT